MISLRLVRDRQTGKQADRQADRETITHPT